MESCKNNEIILKYIGGQIQILSYIYIYSINFKHYTTNSKEVEPTAYLNLGGGF